MTRTYERETIRWERADIEALEAAGRALYFPGLPGYVIDKKYPVRNHQILDASYSHNAPLNLPVVDHNRVRKAEALVEQLQTLRHGPAENRDGEFDEESRQLVDAILNSDEAELEHSVREEIAVLESDSRQAEVDIWHARQIDEDTLLAKFGV